MTSCPGVADLGNLIPFTTPVMQLENGPVGVLAGERLHVPHAAVAADHPLDLEDAARARIARLLLRHALAERVDATGDRLVDLRGESFSGSALAPARAGGTYTERPDAPPPPPSASSRAESFESKSRSESFFLTGAGAGGGRRRRAGWRRAPSRPGRPASGARRRGLGDLARRLGRRRPARREARAAPAVRRPAAGRAAAPRRRPPPGRARPPGRAGRRRGGGRGEAPPAGGRDRDGRGRGLLLQSGRRRPRRRPPRAPGRGRSRRRA